MDGLSSLPTWVDSFSIDVDLGESLNECSIHEILDVSNTWSSLTSHRSDGAPGELQVNFSIHGPSHKHFHASHL